MTLAPYPKCGWHQSGAWTYGKLGAKELCGLARQCLLAGIVVVQLPEGGTANLCTTHADRFARGPHYKANKAKYQIIANQIEAE
jgi:hypothetical protein